MPFKCDEENPLAYTVLHIQELRSDTVFDPSWPWWRKERFSHYIDTVIENNNSITMKYLPGEGKMFQVSIIYDNTAPLNGELAFNNQTKLVAYPAHQTSNYDFWKDITSGELNFFKDDSLYYHIVYHRKMPEENNDRYRVYYRRSMFPYTGDIATKTIQWGPELLVSDTIVFTKANHIPSLDVDTLACKAGINISCRFPAIVVRYNEVAEKPYVYIVYSCDQPIVPDTSRIFMVECAFPQDTVFPNNRVPSLRPIMRGFVNNSHDSLQYVKFGGVSINASFSGNYYTWCDSINGIGVGWKAPNDRGYITNFKHIRHNLAAIGTQPALNTYSRFSIAEDNCALVFREQVGNDSQSKIIYTRLHNNPLGLIDNYLPPTFCEPLVPNHTKGEYSINGKTAIINNIHPMPFYYNASYPTIYRLASFTLRPGYEYLDSMHYVGACWDRVCWTGTLSPDETSLKSIYMKNIDIADNNDCWFLLPEIKFWSPMYNLDHPHLSSGAASYKKDGTFAEYGQSDSANIIHYIAYPILDDLSYNADIYHRKFHTWTNYLARWDSGNPEDGQINFIEYMQPIGKGIYPHTSHTPVFTDKKDWHINSRVFQTINEQITTSSKLFLKGTTNKMAIRPLLMVSDSNANALISEINFTDSNAPLKLHAFSNTEHGFTALDTIYSDWFKIGSVKELSFLSLIKDSTIFSFTLEGGNGEIALSSGQESQLNRRNLTFLNGQNELYRLKLVKKNNSQTWFEILLDSEEEIYNKSVVISDIYDLSNSQSELYIYPNPAGDYINILINNNGVILSRDVQILNILGLVVSKSVLTDSNNRIDISNLPRGTYFIRIGDKLDKFVKL